MAFPKMEKRSLKVHQAGGLVDMEIRKEKRVATVCATLTDYNPAVE
jgi:hypothetical protein